MQHKYILIIETGENHSRHRVIRLNTLRRFLLGRSTNEQQVDVSINNHYVSRQHAEIFYHEGMFHINDLGSKHGTAVNNILLKKGISRELKVGDRISLANDQVILTFSQDFNSDVTLTLIADNNDNTITGLLINEARRSVNYQGYEIELTGRLFRLMQVLDEKSGFAISQKDIKEKVWYDRAVCANGERLVNDEEVKMLIYRLRTKIEPLGLVIRTIRGYGYILEER